MSVFSKILESLSKNITKELDKQAQKSAGKEASKNLAKPSVKSDIMPSKNPHARGQMQDNIIKEFGTNYAEFKGKGQEAIKHLLEVKNGQVQGAFYRDDLGEITLAWGKEGSAKSDGYGLAKIAKYHPEVLDNLTQIVETTPLTKETPNRYTLENDKHFLAIRREFDGKSEKWLLTAFEKDESATKRRTDLPSTPKGEAKKTTSANTHKGNSSTNSTKLQDSTQNLPFNRE